MNFNVSFHIFDFALIYLSYIVFIFDNCFHSVVNFVIYNDSIAFSVIWYDTMKYNHVGCIRSRASIFGTVLFVSVKPQVVAELFRPIACYNVWPHNSDDWFMTLISIVKWDEMVLQTNLQLGGHIVATTLTWYVVHPKIWDSQHHVLALKWIPACLTVFLFECHMI